MGLDFTSIPDKTGAALYILHTGSMLEAERLEHLRDEISRTDNHQVVLVDVTTADGEKIRDFYDITADQLPVAMIIADDDSIAQQWSGDAIPAADVITYQLDQISS